MSGFSGRRAPNFAQYLEDLNTIPSPYEQSSHQQDDAFNLEAELAMFTNTEFLEFDHFPIIDMPPPSDTFPSENTSHESGLSNPDIGTDYLNIFNSELLFDTFIPESVLSSSIRGGFFLLKFCLPYFPSLGDVMLLCLLQILAIGLLSVSPGCQLTISNR